MIFINLLGLENLCFIYIFHHLNEKQHMLKYQKSILVRTNTNVTDCDKCNILNVCLCVSIKSGFSKAAMTTIG